MSDLDLLRTIAGDAPPPDDAVRQRARAALLAHMDAAPAGRPTHRRVRWLVAAAGLAATTAAAALIGFGAGSGGEETASAATAALRNASAVASRQAGPPRLERGQYLYVKSVNAYLTTSVYGEGNAFSALVPHVREIWQGPDGGRLRETSGKPRFLSERDRARWVANGRPQLGESTGEAELPPLRRLALPSDPDVLYERLEREAEGHSEGVHEQMFTLVGDALRETSATPRQRAALYEVAARIPGVELVGRVTDPAGRAGTAVAMRHDEDKIRHTLVFDPATSTLLSEEQVALADNAFGYPEGTVIGHSTYLVSGVVDSKRERP